MREFVGTDSVTAGIFPLSTLSERYGRRNKIFERPGAAEFPETLSTGRALSDDFPWVENTQAPELCFYAAVQGLQGTFAVKLQGYTYTKLSQELTRKKFPPDARECRRGPLLVPFQLFRR